MGGITHKPHKRKPKPTHQETMLSLAMSKLSRLNSGTAQLSEIMDAEKQVREWRDKCETNTCVSDGPDGAHKSTRSAEGPFAARNG